VTVGSTGGLTNTYTWTQPLNPASATSPNNETVITSYDTDFPLQTQTPNGTIYYTYGHIRDAAWKKRLVRRIHG